MNKRALAQQMAGKLVALCKSECKGDTAIAGMVLDDVTMTPAQVASQQAKILGMSDAERDELTGGEMAQAVLALCDGDKDKANRLIEDSDDDPDPDDE